MQEDTRNGYICKQNIYSISKYSKYIFMISQNDPEQCLVIISTNGSYIDLKSCMPLNPYRLWRRRLETDLTISIFVSQLCVLLRENVHIWKVISD